ncbi:MAG TPA: histidinol dehydrogenase [Acholeplasmataceae bacterium]|nr:histidinol dehydrogenase [Acholeplasmataceae bacterium]
MIKIIQKENRQAWYETWLMRAQLTDDKVNQAVKDILNNVIREKDAAVKRYTHAFDGALLTSFLVTEDEINDAFSRVSPDLIRNLNYAKANIENYHQKQINQDFRIENQDTILGQRTRPIETVGIYVPGGTAAYPSTVLMNAIPAKMAGVNKIIMVTPPSRDGKVNPNILVAAKLVGIDAIYKVGGAQAIGALAYGTQQIPKVNKIVGPGNIYVAVAKKMVMGDVGIDMIAGPSEVLIIADETAKAKEVAADLFAQAEHDVLASSLLITTSQELANRVQDELESMIPSLKRSDIIRKSIDQYGAIVMTQTLDEAIQLANQIAPEHLEIMTDHPWDVFDRIEHAGSVFLGRYTPEPVGDYVAGPNHTLPTSGTATFASPLSVYDFVKRTSYVSYSEKALSEASSYIIGLAEAEGLDAHAYSIKVRQDENYR